MNDPYSSDFASYPTGGGGGGGGGMMSSISILLLILLGVLGLFYFMKISPTNSIQSTFGGRDTTTKGSSQDDTSTVPKTTQTYVSPVCQQISDSFGTFPGNWKDGTSPDIVQTWQKNGCNTVPSTWTCQDISDAYGISPTSKSNRYGTGIMKTYQARGCTTSPKYNCQEMSEKYKIWPLNAAPLDDLAKTNPKEADVVRTRFFSAEDCQTIPKDVDCQQLSNFFLISPSDGGIAMKQAPGMLGIYKSKGCNTSPLSCEMIANLYGIQNIPTENSVDKAWSRWGNPCVAKESPDPKFLYEPNYSISNANVPELYTSTSNLNQCLNYCKGDSNCLSVTEKLGPGNSYFCAARSYSQPMVSQKDSNIYLKRSG